MKRLLSVILAALIMMLSMLSSSAAVAELCETGKTVVDYGNWMLEKIDNDTHWELDEYRGSETDVIPPRIVDNMVVVSFGSHCFANNITLKTVTTDSPLWTVGEYAFLNCSALETFVCNYGMQNIEIGAFSGTTSLKNIDLEVSAVTEIKPYAFLNSGIEEITLPATCVSLGSYAFGQCKSLKKIVIPASVTSIHDNAFISSDKVVIYCYTDSYAHQYAVNKNIPFVLIDAPVEVTFIMGDADGDGYITVLDATKVQRVLAGLDEDPDGMIALRAADGEVLNIMHATAIQRYLADYDVKEPIGEEVTRTVTV